MSPPLLLALVSLGAYLAGGIPFGYLIARARGVDILAQGSGNIGATNVGRVLGRRFGILVFLLDFAKGALPAAVGRELGGLAEPAWGTVGPELLGVSAGLCAFLGHVFPVYLGFRGGKGVATGAGVVAVLLPGPFLGGLVVWLAVLCAGSYVSLASVAAAAGLVALRLTLAAEPFAPENVPGTVFCFLAAGLVFLRHRANLIRLLHGNENRLRDTPAMRTAVRILHLLSLGLWFGTAVFFTFFVGPVLFSRFEALGEDVRDRPAWLPTTRNFEKRDSQLDGPREQGTRVAGAAVTPLFPWYFGIQAACGLLAVGTAFGLGRWRAVRVHRLRIGVLLAALVTLLIGWLLELKVDALRAPRHEAVDAFLRSSPETAPRTKAAAVETRREFGLWHGLSLLLNLGTLLLATTALVLAARLPQDDAPQAGQQMSADSTRVLEPGGQV
jgi:glycerol-3-phosphate acyltransferase PlsY